MENVEKQLKIKIQKPQNFIDKRQQILKELWETVIAKKTIKHNIKVVEGKFFTKSTCAFIDGTHFLLEKHTQHIGDKKEKYRMIHPTHLNCRNIQHYILNRIKQLS